MSYRTENEIRSVVRAFETGAIRREDWRHAEHLIVAVHYAWHHGYETALTKMRAGILDLLRCFEIDLSKEMPYHETLTAFWMRKVCDVVEKENGKSLVETTNAVLRRCADKDLPLKFYSRERLFSDKARAMRVAPDLD